MFVGTAILCVARRAQMKSSQAIPISIDGESKPLPPQDARPFCDQQFILLRVMGWTGEMALNC